MYQYGFNIVKYISLEKIIEQTKSEYYDCLYLSSKEWHKGNNSPLDFVKYILRVILRAYQDFEKKAGSTNSNATNIVADAIQTFYGKFRKQDIIEKCSQISGTTTEREINKLVKSKKIIKHGNYKSTYYTKA